MKTKAEIIEQIKADPEETLRDIEVLRSQLMADRLVLKGKEGLVRYFAAIADDYWHKYHRTRQTLIRARILVKELKQACQAKQG